MECPEHPMTLTSLSLQRLNSFGFSRRSCLNPNIILIWAGHRGLIASLRPTSAQQDRRPRADSGGSWRQSQICRSPSWTVFSPPEPHGAGAKKLGSVAKTDGYGTEQYWNLVNLYRSRTRPIIEGPK